MSGKIVAYYLRVSTNRQEKEETIDSQRFEVEEKIKEDGNILGENCRFEDDGWSGDLLARPALDAMRDSASKKEFEILYVWDRDRIARKYSYQELIMDEIQDLSIEIIDLHSAPVRNMEDKILLGFKGLFAEYEKAKIGERMRRGKLYKARSGVYMNLSAPYGYTYIPRTKDSDPRLEINEEEAEIVRKIFHWIADQKFTIRGTIKRLHQLGILPKKKKRATWTNGPLGRLLRNEAYIGHAYYNKGFATIPLHPKTNGQYKRIKKSSRGKRPKEEWIPVQVPAILDEKLYYQVQEQMMLNQKYNRRNRKAPYLLTGVVYCVCGRRRTGEGVRHHRYYRCTDRIARFPLPRQCNASGVNAYHLDDKVWEKVATLLKNHNLIKKQAEKWMAKKHDSQERSQDSVGRLNSILVKLQEEEKRYVKAYGAGLLTIEQFKEQTKELRERKGLIESDMQQASEVKVRPNLDLSRIEGLTQKVAGMIQSFDLEEKREVLQSILESVTIGDGRKVFVKGYIPLERYAQNVKLWPISRNRGTPKRWKVDVV